MSATRSRSRKQVAQDEMQRHLEMMRKHHESLLWTNFGTVGRHGLFRRRGCERSDRGRSGRTRERARRAGDGTLRRLGPIPRLTSRHADPGHAQAVHRELISWGSSVGALTPYYGTGCRMPARGERHGRSQDR